MTLSRILSIRLRSGINTLEYRRWCSLVNDKGEISNKSEVAEQRKAMAVEIFEKNNRNMTEDEGVFPRENQGQEEVGTWNLFSVLERTKNKLLNHLEHKSHINGALSSTSDSNDSEKTSATEALDTVKMENTLNSAGPEELSNVSSKECEPENQQENIITEACSFSSNLKHETTDTSDSSCALLDVSEEKRNDKANLEAEKEQMQDEEALSDIVSILKKKGTPDLEQVARSNSEAANKWRNVLVRNSVFSSNEYRPNKNISDPISPPEMDEVSSVDQKKGEKYLPRELEHVNGTSRNIFGSGDIRSLMECIKELPPREPCVVRPEEIVVGGNRKGGSNSGIQENTDIRKVIETKENASLSEKLSDENKVTIKFVNSKATESDVIHAFNGCGAITKVVFLSRKCTDFKVAHIYFESEEGRQKALKKCDVIIRNTVCLDTTSPPKTMCIPDLIGYPEVPTTLVKHPSRTVMIQNLKHNVSFHDIKEALAFCGSNITGIFFGSSSTVAFVEFETVEDKEIAIETPFLSVLGERLPLLRIDAPRTTCIRISNFRPLTLGKVALVCKSLGNIRRSVLRNNDLLDVDFKFAEWPRMLEILNRLHGMEVEDQCLVAKPAPFYPADVLQVLWSQPEGRQHLKTVFNNLLLKLEGNGVGTVDLKETVDNFFNADAQER